LGNKCFALFHIKNWGRKKDVEYYFIDENSGAGEWVAFTWLVGKKGGMKNV